MKYVSGKLDAKKAFVIDGDGFYSRQVNVVGEFYFKR